MTPRVPGSFARMTRGWRVSGPGCGSVVGHRWRTRTLRVVEFEECKATETADRSRALARR